ncbi:MAG TPA: shikimate kinase [Candidatus Nanoarchaeia archaeon]|nr:shikimate kinase [Candidatus Nanoarchaeia archaeon]
MNIAIMGFRGTGKTTVCRLLAGKLDRKLILTEEEILKKTGSIPKYVKKYGWDKFREIESEVMEKLSDFDDRIFDVSGDIVMRNENMIGLKKNSVVILLTADLRTIENRLKNKNVTDSYDYADEIKEFFQERETKYKKSADYTIDTSSLSPDEVCELVMHYMELEMH